MSGNTWTNIAVGIVGGVLAYFTFGLSAVLTGFTLGYAASSLILGPDAPKQGQMRPDELQMTQSSESSTVPVIFGTVRMAGNFIAYDPDSFQANEVYAEEEGGKGGGGSEKQQVGWEYFLTWEVALCMGPVDQLRGIQGSPGLDPLIFSGTTSLDGAGAATFTFAELPVDGDTFSIGTYVYTFRNVANDPYEVPVGDMLALFGSFGLISAINGKLAGTPANPLVFASADDFGTITVRAKEIGEGGNGIPVTTTVAGSWDNPTTEGGTQPVDLVDGYTTTIESSKEDGGTVIINPGSRTQVSPGPIQGLALNYRDVCFARFVNFKLGNSPAPRSYLFELQRMPKVLDDEGDPIVGFHSRAALTDEFDEWHDANPAAFVWEFLTNKVWGKGRSAATLNEDDFRKASIYFATTRMGVSTALGDDTSLAEQVNRFRDLFGFVTYWDGYQTRCVCIYDRTNAYAIRRRILPEDTIGEPAFSRATMASTTNEVRLEFTNRQNGWQKEAATVMDLANAESIGGIRSRKIDGTEIGTRRCAEIIAHRMLKAMAYPAASCNIKLRRNFSDLQPGGFVELVVDSWRGEAMTTFWRVDSIEDDESGEGDLSVNLIEDIYATGTDGEITDFTAPIPTSDFDDPLTNQDMVIMNYQRVQVLGSLAPVLIDEPNIWISKAERRVVLAVQRRQRSIQTVSLAVKESTLGNFQALGVMQGFAFTGQLIDAVSADGPKNFRQAPWQFRLALTRPDLDAADMLASASSVQTNSDGLDLLTAEGSALLVIGREIIRCGLIEETGENEYTVRIAMRGEFASDMVAHAAGTTFHFLKFWHKSKLSAAAPALPIGIPVDVRLIPNAVNGSGEATLMTGPVAGGFDGNSVRPLRPELASATRVGTNWSIKLRPRIYNGGSNYGPTFEEDMTRREADVGFHRVFLDRGTASMAIPDYFTSGSVGTAAMTVTRFVFIPTDGTNPSTGLWELEVTFDVNPASLTVRGLLSGQTSDPLVIPLPT